MANKQFLVLEGIDGAGKSSVAKAVHRLFYERGQMANLCNEPWYAGEAGEFIQRVLRKEEACSDYMLALAFALNRADHLRTVIEPTLCRGETVICDRYILSSVVYQSGGSLWMKDVIEFNWRFRQPDVTFFLDVKPEIVAERLQQRGSQPTIFEDVARLAEYRSRYLKAMIQTIPHNGRLVVIDANSDLNAVVEQVMEAYDHI